MRKCQAASATKMRLTTDANTVFMGSNAQIQRRQKAVRWNAGFGPSSSLT